MPAKNVVNEYTKGDDKRRARLPWLVNHVNTLILDVKIAGSFKTIVLIIVHPLMSVVFTSYVPAVNPV